MLISAWRRRFHEAREIENDSALCIRGQRIKLFAAQLCKWYAAAQQKVGTMFQLSYEQRQYCFNSIFNCNNSAIKKIFNKIIVIMEQLIFTLKFLWKGNDGLPLFSRVSVLRISVCRSHFYSSSTVENKKRSKKRPKFRKNISETFLVVSSAF